MPKLDDLTVEELKDKLAERDLPTTGNKAELVARLRGQAVEGATPAKRATHLDRFPELGDEVWVAGNPAQAKALADAAEEMGPVPPPQKTEG